MSIVVLWCLVAILLGPPYRWCFLCGSFSTCRKAAGFEQCLVVAGNAQIKGSSSRVLRRRGDFLLSTYRCLDRIQGDHVYMYSTRDAGDCGESFDLQISVELFLFALHPLGSPRVVCADADEKLRCIKYRSRTDYEVFCHIRCIKYRSRTHYEFFCHIRCMYQISKSYRPRGFLSYSVYVSNTEAVPITSFFCNIRCMYQISKSYRLRGFLSIGRQHLSVPWGTPYCPYEVMRVEVVLLLLPLQMHTRRRSPSGT